MRYTTRNCLQLPLPSRNGVDISRVLDRRLVSIRIIVGWTEWFTQKKPLNRRQARWTLELDGFDFHIIYRPGAKNTKPDTLSTRAEHRPE